MKTISTFVVLAALPVAAADMTGSWKLEGDIGVVHVNRVCTIKQTDSKLSGSCKNEQNEVELTGSVDGKNVTWQYTANFDGHTFPLVFKGTAESESSIKGKAEIPGATLVRPGDFTATKQR